MKHIKEIFPDFAKNREAGKCATCGESIVLTDFKDELSVKEFQISGMCMLCQNEIFR